VPSRRRTLTIYAPSPAKSFPFAHLASDWTLREEVEMEMGAGEGKLEYEGMLWALSI